MTTTRTQYMNSPGANSFFTVLTTDASYASVSTDRYVNVNSGVAHALTLFANPNAGDTIVVRDVSGNASTNNITITPASGNIDGAANFIVKVNKAVVTLVYSGTEWNVLGRKSTSFEIPLFSGVASEALGVWTRISNYYWEPEKLSLPNGAIFKMFGVCEVNNGIADCEVRLYNLTDAAVITGSTLSTNSLTPDAQISASLTMPTTPKMLEVQIRTTDNAYIAICTNAGLRVTE
jgi:hypothetical protein